MTVEKVREVIALYRKQFEDDGVPKFEFPRDQIPANMYYLQTHCHWMLDKMEGFLDEGNMGKAFRWLGFIQGVLWVCGEFTIDELANQNRPA